MPYNSWGLTGSLLKAARILVNQPSTQGAIGGIFFNQGEVCCAGSRLFVEDEIHDEFVSALVEYAGKIKICKMNVDECQKTPAQFGVRGIPTLILFKNGQAEGQKIGAVRKADVAAFLDSKL